MVQVRHGQGVVLYSVIIRWGTRGDIKSGGGRSTLRIHLLVDKFWF